MATTITEAFVRQYEREVHHIFQKEGGLLRRTVRTKDNIVGKSTTFQKIGKGTATTKARHGTITPMNQDHTAHEATLADFYAGDWVDRLDEAKTNIDERMAIAQGGAWALGRKVDNQIFTVADGTTESSVTITLTSAATVENSFLTWIKNFEANDVPNDGQRYGQLTPFAWAVAMKIDSFRSADYIAPNQLPFTEGAPSQMPRFKMWMNVNWHVHTGCPGVGTATAKPMIWHKNSIGYATGAHPNNAAQMDSASPVSADITWHGDRYAHFVNHAMSGGGVLIDTTGVIEGAIDDTGSLPTS